MLPLLFAGVWHYLLGGLLFLTSCFLILLILVQRGRGGGLTGALGGVGGQSAFGTKAGDLFTRITIGVAAVWILECLLAIAILNGESGFAASGRPRANARGAGTSSGALDSSGKSESSSSETSTSESAAPAGGAGAGTTAGESGAAPDSSGAPADSGK